MAASHDGYEERRNPSENPENDYPSTIQGLEVNNKTEIIETELGYGDRTRYTLEATLDSESETVFDVKISESESNTTVRASPQESNAVYRNHFTEPPANKFEVQEFLEEKELEKVF